MAKVNIVCKTCGVSFEAEYKVRDKRKYCSQKCYKAKPENNPFYGKKHSAEMRAYFSSVNSRGSGSDNPFYGKKHTAETRKRMSSLRKEKIANGEIDVINHSRKGEYKGLRYESAYELARLKQLERDHSVQSYSRNTLGVCYEFGGQHIYLPDFIVHYKDGRKVMEEVKGYETDKDRAKYEAAKPALAEMGIEFRVLYKKDLFPSDQEYRAFLKENK